MMEVPECLRVSRRDRSACRLFLSLVATVLMVACGGSDVVTGVDGSGGGGGGTSSPPPANPSFSQDVNPIFTQKGCTAGNCHGGGSGGMTLNGSAATDYASLVNIVSTANPSFLRVKPGDAQNSYLVMKVEGRAGSRMPIGGSALTSTQIGTIRNWIDSGAANN